MEEMTAEKELFERVPVPKAILRLALPSVVGQIILVVYNMADTFFIGQTGSDAMIAGVTVCMPAFMFLSAIANLFGVGGSSVISRALGKGDANWAKDVSAFAFWGCTALTAVYSLGAFLLMNPFVNALGGSDPTVHSLAASYLICTVVLGGLPTSLNALLCHLIRAEGHSFSASFGIALGGVLNIVLDPIFMFVILAPGQEALGAAIATALSNVIALLYFVILIVRKQMQGHTVLTFRPGKVMLSRGIPADVMSTGLPACLMTLFENISYAVLEHLMALAGTAMQAGIGVAKKVNMLAHCIVRGMAQGVLPLIGYNYASKNRRRMRQVVTLSTVVSVVVASVCTLLCLLFSNFFIGVFIQPGSDSLEYGARFLRILCLGAPFSACAYACISFFQAVGRGRKSFVLAILRKGILDIPLMFILQAAIPIYGIVWATPITDVVCCILALYLFFRFLRKHAGANYPAPAPPS
ncbi:MAG: cation transporter [Oscillospiraceae bacterium]|nr:cation transporter [Oscillospiraceae bacterium]